MFDFDSETEFNYEGGMADNAGLGTIFLAFLGGLVVMLIVVIALVSTGQSTGWMDARTWPLVGSADPKTERLSAVWKNSERLTSKDPEFKGAYERTCGARAN